MTRIDRSPDACLAWLIIHSAANAHWAKLSFTGRTMLPRASNGNGEVRKILRSMQGAIGHIKNSELKSSVKVAFTAK